MLTKRPRPLGGSGPVDGHGGIRVALRRAAASTPGQGKIGGRVGTRTQDPLIKSLSVIGERVPLPLHKMLYHSMLERTTVMVIRWFSPCCGDVMVTYATDQEPD